jgi:hypothetical protein
VTGYWLQVRVLGQRGLKPVQVQLIRNSSPTEYEIQVRLSNYNSERHPLNWKFKLESLNWKFKRHLPSGPENYMSRSVNASEREESNGPTTSAPRARVEALGLNQPLLGVCATVQVSETKMLRLGSPSGLEKYMNTSVNASEREESNGLTTSGPRARVEAPRSRNDL